MGCGKFNKKVLVMIAQYGQEILIYLVFGFGFTMFYDWLLSRGGDDELQFNNFERIQTRPKNPIYYRRSRIQLNESYQCKITKYILFLNL